MDCGKQDRNPQSWWWLFMLVLCCDTQTPYGHWSKTLFWTWLQYMAFPPTIYWQRLLAANWLRRNDSSFPDLIGERDNIPPSSKCPQRYTFPIGATSQSEENNKQVRVKADGMDAGKRYLHTKINKNSRSHCPRVSPQIITGIGIGTGIPSNKVSLWNDRIATPASSSRQTLCIFGDVSLLKWWLKLIAN